MSVRSSTSSSDAAGTGGRASAILLGCGLTLLAIRLAFAIAGPEWRDRPDIESVEALLRRGAEDDVRVVALGSSRMHSAFRADVWARRAGLEESQVLNLAIDNGQFWDARHLLDRTGGLPESVDLVLIEVARWNFNRNKVSPIGERVRYDAPEHFRQQGGLLDRWSVDDPVERTRLLAEAVWPIYQRRTVAEWIEWARRPDTPAGERGVSPHWFEENHARLRALPAFRAASIVRDHYHEPALSSFAVRNFERLLSAARRGGAEVVLVTLPTRAAYHRAIESDAARKRFSEAVDAVVASNTRDGVRRVDCPRARDCGVDARIFVDYGHFSFEGAEALTEAIFERIGRDEGRAAPRARGPARTRDAHGRCDATGDVPQDVSKCARYASSASS